MIQSRTLLAAGLVIGSAAIRLIPYVLNRFGLVDINDPNGLPWNVSPIGAICLFGGACLADRRLAYFVPLMSMVLSDALIGLLMGHSGFGFHALVPVTYAAFGAMVWLGTWLKEHLHRLPSQLMRVVLIAGTGLLAEAFYFLVTNFAEWVVQPDVVSAGGLAYPYTFAGLMTCYEMAIPFFKKSLMGMAVYGTALFGGYEFLTRRVTQPQPSMLVEAR